MPIGLQGHINLGECATAATGSVKGYAHLQLWQGPR